MWTHHSCSEKSPLAAYLSTNSLQAVSSLLQKLQLSSSFISLWPSQSVHCLLHSAFYKWYNQTLRPPILAWALQQACYFQICTLSGTHCLLLSVKLTPQTLSKLTSKLTFSTPSRPCAQPERIELNCLHLQVYAFVCVCERERESVCVCVCVCVCGCECVCVCVVCL